jgi:hypothetical protein
MYSQITGCQSIGKSFTVYYFLFRILSKENPDPVLVINIFGQVDKTSYSSDTVNLDTLTFAEHSTGSQSRPWVFIDSVKETNLQSLIDSSDLNGRIIFVTSDPCHGVSPGSTYCQHLMMHPASLPESVAVALCPRTISTGTATQLPRRTLFVTPLSVAFLRYVTFNGILRRIAHASMSIPVPAGDPCCYWGNASDVSSDTEPPLLVHPRDPVLHGGDPTNKNLRCHIYASNPSPYPVICSSPLSHEQMSSPLHSFTISQQHVLTDSDASLSNDVVVSEMPALYARFLSMIGISTALVDFALRAIEAPMETILHHFQATEKVREVLLRGSISYPLFSDFAPKHAFQSRGDSSLTASFSPARKKQASLFLFPSSTFSGRFLFDKCSDEGFRDEPKIYIESRTVMSPFIMMWLENVKSELYSGLIETLRKTISFAGIGGLFETCYSSQAFTKLFSTPLQTYSNGWSNTGNFMWKSNKIFPKVIRGVPLQSKFDQTAQLSLCHNYYYNCAEGQKWIDGIAVLDNVVPTSKDDCGEDVAGTLGRAILLFQHTVNVDHGNDTPSYKLLVDALLKKFKADYYQTVFVMPRGKTPSYTMFDRYTLSSRSSIALPPRPSKKHALSLVSHKQEGVPDVALCQLRVRDTGLRYTHNSLKYDLLHFSRRASTSRKRGKPATKPHAKSSSRH